ncbi:uncharacterized protein JCM6883_004319 [Sporobolomyces salmoneus]|uniref:uncharacterized protein n=1 Tax=Sporobolomyces salmoneus TaxID=183962 RepID=UPI00317E1A27
MSRYADRRNPLPPPSASSRYERQERSYSPQYPSQSYRGNEPTRSSGLSREPVTLSGNGWDDYEDGEDTVVDSYVSTVVSTAVGTDLSSLKPPTRRRSVSFGANEVEEFNGSEAPDAIEPAPSRQGNRTPLPPTNGALLRAVPVDRPSSRLAQQEQMGRRSPASMAMPPPSLASTQRVPSRSSYPDPPRQAPPQYSDSRLQGLDHSRYNRYGDEVFEDDGGPFEDNDDEDAFTAVGDSTVGADSTAGTGVATDLSLDYDNNLRRALMEDNARPSFPSMRTSSAPAQIHRPGYSQSYGMTSASGFDSSYFAQPDPSEISAFSSSNGGGSGQSFGRLAPPTSMPRPRSTGSVPDRMEVDSGLYSDGIRRGKTPTQSLPPNPARPEDSPVERELIALLKELQFSLALKDFHDTMGVGVERTLVAEDGRGHAYCKIHCKKLPRHDDIVKHRHLRKHWIPITGSSWEFRTPSHSVTCVFKTAAIAAYEAQFTTSRH